MMNQSSPENGYRLKKSEKLFIKLFVMLLRSIAWTSRTELENEGIIDEARRLHGGFILSTWHRDIFFSIWMFRELNLTPLCPFMPLFTSLKAFTCFYMLYKLSSCQDLVVGLVLYLFLTLSLILSGPRSMTITSHSKEKS